MMMARERGTIMKQLNELDVICDNEKYELFSHFGICQMEGTCKGQGTLIKKHIAWHKSGVNNYSESFYERGC